MSKSRKDLLESIADRIADYRTDEIDPRSANNVEAWVRQFNPNVQDAILAEMVHVLERVYISKKEFEDALRVIVRTAPDAKPDPTAFWRTVNFLWIQDKGDSQKHMRQLLAPALKAETGLSVEQCGSKNGPYVYLDDSICTATHVRWDLIEWIKSTKGPQEAEVIVLAMVMHSGRTEYTERQVIKEASAAGKKISFKGWWHLLGVRDNESRNGETDVLKPKSFPTDDKHVTTLTEYLIAQGKPFVPRRGLTTAKNKVFSSESARDLLEQQFLIAGARIKYELCPNLKQNHWPLGYDVFKSAGFGTMVVTFRNCPNNCPLVLWAGTPWRPLFPRRANPTLQNIDWSIFSKHSESSGDVEF